MIIAIEDGMKQEKKVLEEAGHWVVPLHGYKGAVDAVVYRNTDWQFLPSATNARGNGGGVFVVCASHMSAEEVLQSVENRSYGTIF